MLPNPEIFGLNIQWYSFFHWLGVFAAVVFGGWYSMRKATFRLSILQWIGFFVVLYCLLLFGGRVAGLYEFYLVKGYFPDLSILWQSPSSGRFRWCGSVLFVFILLPVIGRKLLRIESFNLFFDMLAIAFCVLTVFTKQGCQFSGDGCYGVPTTLPWGMYYPYGSAPNILPVHPTPVYDSIFHFFLFVFLMWWDKRKSFAGQTALLYFFIASAFYVLLELIRINPATPIGVTMPQLIYFIVIVVTLFRYLNLSRLVHSKQVKNPLLMVSKR